MNIDAIKTTVATRLPKSYESLSVTFYGLNSKQKGDYLIIGKNLDLDICLNVRDGRLYAVDPTGRLPVRFVNSGLDQFIGFLNIYIDFEEKLGRAYETGDKGYWELLRSLRPKLEAIDKEALGAIQKWWEPAVEQLEEENQ